MADGRVGSGAGRGRAARLRSPSAIRPPDETGTPTRPAEEVKRRCADRCDSSESSDSGVAVLSCADFGGSGGSSGSDITEPGSPAGPGSAPRRRPRPPKRPRAPEGAAPAERRRQQGRITEYFRAQMKPTDSSESLRKYIALLTRTLDPKAPPEGPAAEPEGVEGEARRPPAPRAARRREAPRRARPPAGPPAGRFAPPASRVSGALAPEAAGPAFVPPPGFAFDPAGLLRVALAAPAPRVRPPAPPAPAPSPAASEGAALPSPGSPGDSRADAPRADDSGFEASEGEAPREDASTDSSEPPRGEAPGAKAAPAGGTATPPAGSPAATAGGEVDEDSLDAARPSPPPVPAAPPSETIRFPARKQHQQRRRAEPGGPVAASPAPESKPCRWSDCALAFDDASDLLEHLQDCHVNAQADRETYRCLWQGCKVFNRPSCSRTWLERHVLPHGGRRVHRCIVDGCGKWFNTPLALHKHVNNHFTGNESNVSSAKKSLENSGGSKLIRRNGKKLRYRRQPWSARMFDYFDAGIMEGLQYRIVRVTAWRSGGAAGRAGSSGYSRERAPHCVTVAATVLARRLGGDRSLPECLVRWSPPDVLDDEWLPERDFVPTRDVPIKSLDTSARGALYASFCASYRSPPSESAPSGRRGRAADAPRRECLARPVNGFSKAVDGSVFDARRGHNNISKTDRLIALSESHRSWKSECSNSSEISDRNSISSGLAGAAKRKRGRAHAPPRERAVR